MEATLLSSQMFMEVNGLPVETGEALHAFALRFYDPLYGTFDRSHAALRIRWRPEPRACFDPELLKDMQRFGVWIHQNRGTIQFASGENYGAINRGHIGCPWRRL